jgi:hypothetical protein
MHMSTVLDLHRFGRSHVASLTTDDTFELGGM